MGRQKGLSSTTLPSPLEAEPEENIPPPPPPPPARRGGGGGGGGGASLAISSMLSMEEKGMPVSVEKPPLPIARFVVGLTIIIAPSHRG